MLHCSVDGEFGQTWKTHKNGDDADNVQDEDKMQTTLKKCSSRKIGGELRLVAVTKYNLVCVDEKC